MEYFVVCTTQINFTQRKMFLGKWNSDNSYYLYEQIKALFCEATGAAVFIGEGWSAVPPQGKPRSPCWDRGTWMGSLQPPWAWAVPGLEVSGGWSAPLDTPAASARPGQRSQGLPSALLQNLDGLRDAPGQTQSFTAAVESPFSAKLLFWSFSLTVVMLIQPLQPVVAVAPYTHSIFWHKTSLSLNSEESQGNAPKQHLKNYRDLCNVPNATEN